MAALSSLIFALSLVSEQYTMPALGSLIRHRHLSVNGINLLLAGGTLETYEYSSEAELEHDIRPLLRTRQLQAHSNWIQTPYGFKKDRLLVLYTGSSPSILGLLSRVMGPCFLEP